MRADLVAELATIARAVKVLSPSSFTFAGQTVRAADAPLASPYGGPAPKSPLIGRLQQYLYTYCYSRRFRDHPRLDVATSPDDALVSAMAAANTSRSRWDAGWQLSGTLPSGQFLARKGAETRALWPGEFVVADGAGVRPQTGTMASLFVPNESRSLQPGFYFIFGEALAEQPDHVALVRFYWNITDTGAPLLVGLITRELNRFGVPFRLKCLTTRAHFDRTDTAVLFVHKRFYRLVAELLADVRREVAAHLERDTPLFTKALAPGLGFAEDPIDRDSFGMARCRVVAEGFWAAFERGAADDEARLAAVATEFERQGFSLDQPYLNPGAADEYPFPE